MKQNTEKLIRTYIMNHSGFTFYTDIAERTIWGFKGAPYKSFSCTMRAVKRVVATMEKEGAVEVIQSEGCQPAIHPNK